jgi:hypothetical protein
VDAVKASTISQWVGKAMNAIDIIHYANPKAFVHVDDQVGVVTMIEDVGVPGKLYRLEFQTYLDGRKAVAYVRHSPEIIPPEMPHLSADGQLDLGHKWQRLESSSTPIAEAIFKARFWCTAHSHFMANSNLISLESSHG